jgi:hypothetical protein
MNARTAINGTCHCSAVRWFASMPESDNVQLHSLSPLRGAMGL